jgi:hypothetical protein
MPNKATDKPADLFIGPFKKDHVARVGVISPKSAELFTKPFRYLYIQSWDEFRIVDAKGQHACYTKTEQDAQWFVEKLNS